MHVPKKEPTISIIRLVRASAPIIASLGLFSFTPANAQSAFIDVEFGGNIICAIRDDNEAICNAKSNVAGRTPIDLPPVTDIASGNSVACAVLISGDLRCWGQDDGYGLLTPPTSGAPYKAVETDNTHSCAINRDNGIECWGLSSNDRLDAPAGAFQQISLSARHACALDVNGTVSCWGLNESGTSDVPADLPAAQKVTSGSTTSCALLLDGSIQCWGRPLPTPNSGPYLDLATSSSGTIVNGRGGVCGIDTAGKLDCVFRNYQGSGATFPLVFSSTSAQVPTTLGNSNISMRGATNGCFITSAGDIDCFGDRSVDNVPKLVGNDAVPATTGLRAEIYSDTTIELFWDAPRDAFNVAGFEIQRNGEVVAITQNGSSYIVDDIVPGALTNFAVRRVSINGNTGPFSDNINIITGGSTTGPNNGSGDYEPPIRPFEPAALDALIYSSNTLELVWERASSSAIDGYEIRRDGVFIGFTSGTSYFEQALTPDRTYRYDVIPVNREDSSEFYGFSSITVNLGNAEPGVCN